MPTFANTATLYPTYTPYPTYTAVPTVTPIPTARSVPTFRIVGILQIPSWAGTEFTKDPNCKPYQGFGGIRVGSQVIVENQNGVTIVTSNLKNSRYIHFHKCVLDFIVKNVQQSD